MLITTKSCGAAIHILGAQMTHQRLWNPQMEDDKQAPCPEWLIIALFGPNESLQHAEIGSK